MKRPFLGLALVGTLTLALSTPSTPAGACSVFCPMTYEDLFLTDVVVLEGAEDAPLPDWSGDAYIEAENNGWVVHLQVGDVTYVLDEIEEVN